MPRLSVPALIIALLLLAAPAAFATPTMTASLGTGSVHGVSGDFGTVTLTQVSTTEIDMLIQLGMVDGYQVGFTTARGKYNAFTFNLREALAGLTQVSILSPTSGVYRLMAGMAKNEPFGRFTHGVDCPGCGTAGDVAQLLAIRVTNAAGIAFSDFVANPAGAYFAADLRVHGRSGVIAAEALVTGGASGVPAAPVPEPASVALLGVALAGLAFFRRRGAHDAGSVVTR